MKIIDRPVFRYGKSKYIRKRARKGIAVGKKAYGFKKRAPFSRNVKRVKHRANTNIRSDMPENSDTTTLTQKWSPTTWAKIRSWASTKQYTNALIRTLTDVKQLVSNLSTNISVIGDARQGYCQWYAHACLKPSDYDNILSSANNSVITSVPVLQKAWLERAYSKATYRNGSNRAVEMSAWVCYPRKDIENNGTTYLGVNPTAVSLGFTEQVQSNQTTSAITWNQYGATPFQSTRWCQMFKMRKLFNKVLEVGQQHVVCLSNNKSKVICKSKYNTAVADAIASNYAYPRDHGALILIRFQGTPSHRESTATLPLDSASGTYLTMPSGFSIDLVREDKLYFRNPYSVPTRSDGMITAKFNATGMTGSMEYQFTQGGYSEVTDVI